ncbi:MAG: ImmA/IrrE family metallo-endopeptidase [Rhizobiales bacterium]|nr:ImmA/IrrE family metallo-endopeptidase [Hyphomicrobiales bacterium]
MKITRLDLDDTGSPEGLVTKILKAEPDLPVPVPVEELAQCVDITDIATLTTEGYEGGLITDDCKSEGVILVNAAARRGRRRFTIGHELGHFLIPTHRPAKSGQFLCSREDMRRWSVQENDAYARMEVEANRFSALLLMPPPILRGVMEKFRDPDLAHITELAGLFDVSKEPAARAYANYHHQPVAIAVVKDSIVLRIYKHTKFPRIGISYGSPVPRNSLFHYAAKSGQKITEVRQNGAELWLESDWGKRLPTLYEQVFYQQEGFALIMLWVEQEEEDEERDPEENRTARQRWQDRLSGRNRW